MCRPLRENGIGGRALCPEAPWGSASPHGLRSNLRAHRAMALRRRTARLRPEYAAWYPLVEIDRWHDAAVLCEAVRLRLGEGLPAGPHALRILSDVHFEFQGGVVPVYRELPLSRECD